MLSPDGVAPLAEGSPCEFWSGIGSLRLPNKRPTDRPGFFEKSRDRRRLFWQPRSRTFWQVEQFQSLRRPRPILARQFTSIAWRPQPDSVSGAWVRAGALRRFCDSAKAGSGEIRTQMSAMAETDLYLPLKTFLEGAGYSVKGEINSCDLVGVKDGCPPVLIVCEMKLAFSLELVMQGVDRASVCDEVWIAARASRTGKGREQDPRFRNLCRRLGFGLVTVGDSGTVEVVVAPFAATPRRDARRRSALFDEHRRRKGDPQKGGGRGRPIMTAYRQDCIICATCLLTGPQSPSQLKALVARAPTILRRNVYGWFVRERRGVYGLTELGRSAVLPPQD